MNLISEWFLIVIVFHDRILLNCLAMCPCPNSANFPGHQITPMPCPQLWFSSLELIKRHLTKERQQVIPWWSKACTDLSNLLDILSIYASVARLFGIDASLFHQSRSRNGQSVVLASSVTTSIRLKEEGVVKKDLKCYQQTWQTAVKARQQLTKTSTFLLRFFLEWALTIFLTVALG